jgi:hypothetical protein
MDIRYLLPGLSLAALGFALLFGLLASQGALAKHRQFAATADLASGRAGTTKRLLFGLSILGLGCGLCGTFAGVGRSDDLRRQRCVETCTQRGYTKGEIRGSTEMSEKAGRHAFVACACSGGPDPDPLELEADALMDR